MVMQTCHEKKKSSGLISLQLDPMMWETASPRTHNIKIVNESLGPPVIIYSFGKLTSFSKVHEAIFTFSKQSFNESLDFYICS